ncbi:2-keto-4-pentenoate hydratase [Swingsia samuiensis]|uniref:2-keto-4-pentenoate hydratase n=1 Tax=Swingsia samuiensis TaxID=1293412 RepID=A0A4Y6UGV8_9PROT|nr:fumarylacetoacetate hydrolase family protein [Swingsia samuiensis]QDH16812.1 2-keto-4-pentenoate hydratase [Swingsia samuiensis]
MSSLVKNKFEQTLDQNEQLKAYGDLLLEARRTKRPIPAQGFPYKVDTEEMACAVQNYVVEAWAKTAGGVRAWKVGASTPQAEPFAAPIHQGTLFSGNKINFPENFCRLYGVEAEIVYTIGKELPFKKPGQEVWSREEVLSTIVSAHPAIEICDTRFSDYNSQDPLVHRADQANHGALIYGEAYSDWQNLIPTEESVKVMFDGETAVEHKGGNSAGDPLRMLVWLANHAQERGFPFKVGDVVTTGSTMGTIFVPGGTLVRVEFGSLGVLTVQLP